MGRGKVTVVSNSRSRHVSCLPVTSQNAATRWKPIMISKVVLTLVDTLYAYRYVWNNVMHRRAAIGTAETALATGGVAAEGVVRCVCIIKGRWVSRRVGSRREQSNCSERTQFVGVLKQNNNNINNNKIKNPIARPLTAAAAAVSNCGRTHCSTYVLRYCRRTGDAFKNLFFFLSHADVHTRQYDILL